MIDSTLRGQVLFYALLGSLVCMVIQAGASFYERVVLDSAWPRNLELIRLGEGHFGANRKLFWIPAHVAATVFLPAALIAGWSRPELRWPLAVAMAFYVAMRVWSSLYFIPVAIRFESGESTDLEQARTWVRWTIWRLPLVLGSCAGLVVALRRVVFGG